MKFKVSIILFFIFILLSGISLAQNKVVVIPLMSDCNEIPTVTSAGQVWMDRNLGAARVAQSMDDYFAFGFLYQWGRLADGHEDRGSETTTTLSPDNVPGHDDFITTTDYPYDWRDPPHPGLWGPLTSYMNNPCPAGFRVPTYAEWATEWASWSSNNAAGAFASPLKLVMAGRRDHGTGTVINALNFGYYWSSTIFGDKSRILHFSSSSIGINYSRYRAYGYSVRCIKD